MKNKKNVIIISMLAMIAVMIVGYAAFSASLKINGIANIESNWEILFTNIEIVNKTNGATETILPEVTGTSATFGVNLKLPGDYIEYEITVENRGTMDAIVENINASETGNESFTFEITNIAKGDTLAKESSTTFNVKVSFDENATSIPIDPKNILTLEIMYVQDLGQDVDSEDVIINSATLTTLSGNTTLSLVNSAGRKLTNYTISGNSVQNGTPTPDTPIEIESVGDKTKNLFNIMNVTSNMITYDYIEYLEDYSGFVMKNSRFANGIPIAKLSDLCPELKVGDTFVFNFETNAIRNNTPVTYFYLDVYGATIMKGTKYVCTQEMLDSRVHPYSGSTENAYIKNIQFELGETATEYEPYGYKIPVEVSGKNHFDINNVKFAGYNSGAMNRLPKVENGIIYSGGIYTSTEGASMYIETSGESEWTISFDANYASTEEVRNYRISLFNDIDANGIMVDKKQLNVVKVNNKNSITVDATGYKYIGISSYSNNVYGLAMTNLQFEKGNTQTSYEPYVESTTYNIYLDEPLRKIGDSFDYIDFKSNKIVRVIKKTTISSNHVRSLSIGSENNVIISIAFNDSKVPINYNSSIDYIKSNCFGIMQGDINATWRESYNINTIGKPDSNVIWIGVGKDKTTVTEAKDYIDKLKPDLYYVLQTPDPKSIDLPTIRTTEGTSIISIRLDNGVSVPISVEYYKK